MPTMTKSASKSKPKADVVTMTIAINHTVYNVEPIPAGEFGTKAFRLVKHRSSDGAVYDVIRTNDGLVACDCPDYTCRHADTTSMCKHGRSLVSLGLIEAPSWDGEKATPATSTENTGVEPAEVVAEITAPCCSPAETVPCLGCSDVRHHDNVMMPVEAPVMTKGQAHRVIAEFDPQPAVEVNNHNMMVDQPCDPCGLDHGDAGHPSAWGAEADQAWGLAIPEDGEGHGMAGEDLGPADPVDDMEAEDESFADHLLSAASLDTSRLTLHETVRVLAHRFGDLDNALGDFLGGMLIDLSDRIRLTGAKSIAQFEARDRQLCEDRELEIFDRGFRLGRESA